MKYVCLFDIDGTLIDARGAGERAMKATLAEEFGITEITGNIPAAGRTDAAIVRDLFEQHGLGPHEADRFQEAYLPRLTNALPETNGHVLPGVTDVLSSLASREGVSCGLLTGNYARAADAKLDHFELAEHFTFGAFGDIHVNRDDVARDAWQLIESKHSTVTPDRVWIIGDTPADIRCGHAIGAKVLAVGTGIFSVDQLRPHEPDELVATLAEAAEWCDSLA